MAFKGMNPEEGREVASAIDEAGQQILELMETVTGVVNGVEWVGSDYDTYKEDWNSFSGSTVGDLVNGMAERSKGLTQHAEEQDQTSNQG